MEDARRDREAHRQGHGHHQKRRPKAAHPKTVEEEEAEELGIAVRWFQNETARSI